MNKVVVTGMGMVSPLGTNCADSFAKALSGQGAVGKHADANRHSHVNLPVILAGGGGGALTSGRMVKASGVPMTNLLLSMADRMGAKGVERLGDSTGRFEGIS